MDNTWTQAYYQRPTESISQWQHPTLESLEIQSPTRNSKEEKVFLKEQSTIPKERWLVEHLSIKCLADLQSLPFFSLEHNSKTMCQQELVNSLMFQLMQTPHHWTVIYHQLSFLLRRGSYLCSPTKFARSCLPSNLPWPMVQTMYHVTLLKSSHTNCLNLSPPSLTHHFDLVLY